MRPGEILAVRRSKGGRVASHAIAYSDARAAICLKAVPVQPSHPTIQERLVNEVKPKASLLLHQFHPAIFGAALFRLVCSHRGSGPVSPGSQPDGGNTIFAG